MSKSTWIELADVTVGNPYGHVPGHQFHDVQCVVEQRGARYRVTLTEQSGSCQGRDEVHHRGRVVAIDENLDAAVRIANSRAQSAGVNEGYMVQALSQAHAEALDAVMDAEDGEPGPLRYAVVQLGQCVFGTGRTEDEAVADAARWLEDDHGRQGALSPDEVRQQLAGRSDAVDGSLVLIDDANSDFASYLANQGGFEQREDGWYQTN